MGTSAFWQGLAQDHAEDLARHGFEQVKRRQALRYFTWQWRWQQIHHSEQMRFLLRRSRPADMIRALIEPMHARDDILWRGLPWSVLDRIAYVFACRLLWAYAKRTTGHPLLDLNEPELGDPPPVRWHGQLISQDLANTALEINAMQRAGVPPPQHVLEVGGGYGRTAWAFLSEFPQCTYTIVDIEPAASISRWYLTTLFGPDRVRHVTPDEMNTIDDGSVDLCVSISSLQEMTPDTVATYLQLFDRACHRGHVYLKQWQSWRNPVDGVEMRIDDYPVPKGWTEVTREVCPVQTRFVQVAFRLG